MYLNINTLVNRQSNQTLMEQINDRTHDCTLQHTIKIVALKMRKTH